MFLFTFGKLTLVHYVYFFRFYVMCLVSLVRAYFYECLILCTHSASCFIMPSFRWPETRHDIALAKEVASRRPVKPLDWDAIASDINASFSTVEKPVELKGRGCRERMDRLLDKFKSEDARSLKRLV